MHKYLVIKNEDLCKYTSIDQQYKLGLMLSVIAQGRKKAGKNDQNEYIVVNKDDIHAKDVSKIIDGYQMLLNESFIVLRDEWLEEHETLEKAIAAMERKKAELTREGHIDTDDYIQIRKVFNGDYDNYDDVMYSWTDEIKGKIIWKDEKNLSTRYKHMRITSLVDAFRYRVDVTPNWFEDLVSADFIRTTYNQDDSSLSYCTYYNGGRSFIAMEGDYIVKHIDGEVQKYTKYEFDELFTNIG